MKTMIVAAAVLASTLGLSGRAAAQGVILEVPEDYNDAKVISSLLIKRSVADCVAKFDVNGIDTIKRQQWGANQWGPMWQYTFEGTVVEIDIARGRKTMTIKTEMKMGNFGPYTHYTCTVK